MVGVDMAQKARERWALAGNGTEVVDPDLGEFWRERDAGELMRRRGEENKRLTVDDSVESGHESGIG